MRNLSLTVLALLTVLLAAGCTSETELAKVRAEAEAARAEAARNRAEADKALAELARLKGQAPEKPLVKNLPFADETPLAKQFLELRALYLKNAVSLQEWSKLKKNLIDTLPAKASPQDADTLGKRLLDLKKAYEQSAVSLQEWSQAKTKLIAQAPVKNATLNQELLDLKEAYSGHAVSLQEWTRAKAEITNRLKGN